jgi:hypothetical protein
MENLNHSHKKVNPSRKPLRAIVEIIGGELTIFPVANSDTEAATIMNALRFVIEDGAAR